MKKIKIFIEFNHEKLAKDFNEWVIETEEDGKFSIKVLDMKFSNEMHTGVDNFRLMQYALLVHYKIKDLL